MGVKVGNKEKKKKRIWSCKKSILMFTVLKYYMCRTTIINY